MRERIRSAGRPLLLVLVVALVVVPGVAAAEDRTGNTVVVERGETVTGDLNAFGGSVIVRGTVTGDLNAAGGNVRIDGRVDGNVNAAGGDVTLGPDGRVGGNFNAGASSVLVAGRIGGNAEIGADRITLADTARVDGNLRYDGTLVRRDGAVVGGTVSQGASVQGPVAGPFVPGWVFDVYGFLANAVLGIVLLGLLPAFSGRVTERALDEPLYSGGVSLLAMIGIPIVLALIAITIIGIPVALLGFGLFALFVWVGAVYGRIAVGTWLLEQVDAENKWLALLVGLLALAVLTRVPFVGWLFELGAFLLGFGALAWTVYHRYRGRPGEPATPDRDFADDSDVSAT
ncbi:MAG: polymer-forming cytoskeletal protein [Haloarculaceae archaeon]